MCFLARVQHPSAYALSRFATDFVFANEAAGGDIQSGRGVDSLNSSLLMVTLSEDGSEPVGSCVCVCVRVCVCLCVCVCVCVCHVERRRLRTFRLLRVYVCVTLSDNGSEPFGSCVCVCVCVSQRDG